MSISAARRNLHAAIDAATNPADIAQLTIALSRLMDAEGRARGRRQRQNARAFETENMQKATFDPNEPFDLSR